MKAQENTPEEPTELPVADTPPENQVSGMATDEDLNESKQAEETN